MRKREKRDNLGFFLATLSLTTAILYSMHVSHELKGGFLFFKVFCILHALHFVVRHLYLVAIERIETLR